MNPLRLSALTLALVGAHSMAFADESEPAGELTASATGEPDSRPMLWREFSEEGSLLPQLESVFRSLRTRFGVESQIDIETVDVTSANADDRLASREGNCALRPRPGSRIMEERCFYTSAAEESFNQYQFQQEIKQIREAHDRWFLEEAEYGRAYRESLMEGPSLR